jgi:hypothetical protein
MEYKNDTLLHIKNMVDKVILVNMVEFIRYINARGGNISVTGDNIDIIGKKTLEEIKKQKQQLTQIKDDFIQEVEPHVLTNPHYQSDR